MTLNISNLLKFLLIIIIGINSTFLLGLITSTDYLIRDDMLFIPIYLIFIAIIIIGALLQVTVSKLENISTHTERWNVILPILTILSFIILYGYSYYFS